MLEGRSTLHVLTRNPQAHTPTSSSAPSARASFAGSRAGASSSIAIDSTRSSADRVGSLAQNHYSRPVVRAITRAIPDSFDSALSATPRALPIDVALAREQHTAYCAALAACG